MAGKKESKEATATKDVKVKKGLRFLSVFTSAEGSQLIFRAYPSRQEVALKLESSNDEFAKLIRKAHAEAKAQSK